MARGWRGNPPLNDEEARARIVAATLRCVERYGPEKTGLSDVATELGVTRQTVYRLFASTDELLAAVGRTAAGRYLDRLERHVAALTEPADAIIEAIAYTFERLPRERDMVLLLTAGRSEVFLKGVTSADGIAFGRAMVARMNVDWQVHGFDDAALDGLVEFALRVLQSLVLDPPTPKRTRAQLRAFLSRWVAPAIRGVSARASVPT